MKKIYVIFTVDGDIYCGAINEAIAQGIIDADIKKGDLEIGATYKRCNLYDKVEV